MPNCENCKEKDLEIKQPADIIASIYERTVRRLWIALLLAVVLMFASNVGWLIYESQFETMTYEQDGEGINNVNYGEQGDLNNGTESQDQTQEEPQ